MARINVSSGVTSTGLELSTDSMYISYGGTAIGTVAYFSGYFDVNSGGVANNNTVSDGGRMYVMSGGKATSTTVASGGTLSIEEGGMALEILENGGMVYVHDGAKVSFVPHTISNQVFSSTYEATIHSGTTANSNSIDDDGWLYVFSGGIANNTVVNDGWLEVSSGGTANSTTLKIQGGCLRLYSGGTANNTKVSGGVIVARSGGTANSTTIYGGEFDVWSGGVANDVILSGGSLYANGALKKLTVHSGGVATVNGKGTVNSATISHGGSLELTSGGTAIDFQVHSGGELDVYSSGTLTRGTVLSGGTALLRAGTISTSDFVVYGNLSIYQGAEVYGAQITKGARVSLEYGSLTNATVTSAEVILKNGAKIQNATISSGGVLNQMTDSPAVIQGVTVSSGGVLTGILRKASGIVFSGGTLDLNIAKSSEDDYFLVDSSSYQAMSGLSSVTLTVANKQLNGTYKLISNAIGFNTTVTVKFGNNNLGTLTVNGGPTDVGNITCDLTLIDGYLEVTVTGGAVPDPIVSGITLIDERRDITSGMSAIDVKVSAGGILNVFSDGKASNTTVFDGGEFVVESKGDLRGATIYSGGTATIYDDVMAENVVVNGGVYVIESDGWAYQESKGKLVSSNTIVKNGGTMIVSGGGHCGGVIVSDGGHIIVESDGHLGSAFITSGDVTVKDGVESAGATLLDGGVMVVQSGGTGGCTVSSGGVVKVESGGYLRALTVSTGGVVTGVLHDIYTVFRMYGGTLDLDISNAAPGSEYLIDDDANFDPNEDFNCTLTVDGSQANGTYNLMEYAYEFDTKVITAETPLTVKSSSGSTLGTLTVGQTAEIGGANYTLNLSNDHHLTVTISGATPPPIPGGTAKSDIDGNGISDVMFVWTGEHGEGNYQHGYWMNGTNTWQSANSNHPAEWDNLGCYDMTGDGKADSVLFGNVTSEAGIHGAYIGYYADAIDNPDGSTWVNIGYLNNVDNIDWKNKVGNLTGNASGANSIVWYAPELYALGAWTDGTENWVTLNNNFGGDAWTLVGCGDFTGDGKDQVVMALNGGEVYYTVGIDGTSSELTKSDSGWEVRAIGDFAGDDKDDIVAFHKETGLVAMWGDGDSTKWSQLGQLDASDWFIVGAGDYNADAKDDLLVRQKSTGMLGYYASGNMETGWVELGRGVDMNWTVIA